MIVDINRENVINSQLTSNNCYGILSQDCSHNHPNGVDDVIFGC